MSLLREPSPEPTVIDVLLEQHAQIEQLCRTVMLASGDDKRVAFEELAALLQMHEAAEQEVVHPLAAESIDAGPDVIEDRLEEEAEAKELLLELVADGVDAPDFDERFLILRQAVLEHAVREERYEFMRLRAAFPVERLVELAETVRTVEARAATAAR